MILQKKLIIFDADKKSKRGTFDLVLSQDTSKILIVHNKPLEKCDKQNFSYSLINSVWKVLWSKAFELPYLDKYFNLDI